MFFFNFIASPMTHTPLLYCGSQTQKNWCNSRSQTYKKSTAPQWFLDYSTFNTKLCRFTRRPQACPADTSVTLTLRGSENRSTWTVYSPQRECCQPPGSLWITAVREPQTLRRQALNVSPVFWPYGFSPAAPSVRVLSRVWRADNAKIVVGIACLNKQLRQTLVFLWILFKSSAEGIQGDTYTSESIIRVSCSVTGHAAFILVSGSESYLIKGTWCLSVFPRGHSIWIYRKTPMSKVHVVNHLKSWPLWTYVKASHTFTFHWPHTQEAGGP